MEAKGLTNVPLSEVQEKFMASEYPGLKESPTSLVAAMINEDPTAVIESDVLEDAENDCLEESPETTVETSASKLLLLIYT